MVNVIFVEFRLIDEIFTLIVTIFSTDVKDGSTNLTKLMSSLKIPGVSDLMGSNDGTVKDAGVLHNIFEPWPLHIPSTSRKPSLTTKSSGNVDICDDIIDFHMKEISLVYPFLQPVVYLDNSKSTQIITNPLLKPDPIYLKLSRDLSDIAPSNISKDDSSLLDTHIGTDNVPAPAQNDMNTRIAKLVPWDKNESYISIVIYTDETSNISDSPLGFVKVAIKDLLAAPKNEYSDLMKLHPSVQSDKCDVAHSGKQPEINRWYTVSKESLSSRDKNDEVTIHT
jgi:hypothetical protein